MIDLTEIGLSRGESEVYLCLLNRGESTVSDIAKRIKVSRPHIYDILEKLVNKGLVSHVLKESKKFYNITNPNKLVDTLKEKEDFLRRVLPELVIAYSDKKQQSRFEVLEGIEGLKFIFNDILREKPKEWLADGGAGVAVNLLSTFLEIWHKKRTNEKIKLRVIMNGDNASIERGTALSRMPLTEVKFANDRTSSPSTVYVYNNKVAFMIWSEKTPKAILIEDPALYEFFKIHFEESWKNTEGTYTVMKSRHLMNMYPFLNEAYESLDMAGFVCLVSIHEGREKMLSLLNEGKNVRIILCNPNSSYFNKRFKIEEKFIKDIGESRIYNEWKSVIANLIDIKNSVKGDGKLELRLFKNKVDSFILIIDDKVAIYNPYSFKNKKYLMTSPTEVIKKGHPGKVFSNVREKFEREWSLATPYIL